MGKQKCTKCESPSIPGLVNGQGKCPFHWAMQWGLEWASRCHPNHPEAIKTPNDK